MALLKRTLITVVVPCRNECTTLANCLDALETQDFPREDFEVIVVDGGSDDGSADLVRERNLRMLHDDGTGPSNARNVGIHAARSDIIAFTDADCVPRGDWLTRIAEVYAEDPVLAGVAGSLRMPRRTLIGRLEDLEAQAFYRGMITSNVAYRRDVLLQVGGFDESLQCAEDYDLACRILDAGHHIVHDPRPVVTHDPPEVSMSVARYLRKQFWYAKNDVPSSLRALARAKRGGVGSSASVGGFLASLRDAAISGSLLHRMSAPVAAGYTYVSSYRRISEAATRYGQPRDEVARMAMVATLRRLTRGWGTIAGLASPASWRHLKRAELVSLAPVAAAELAKQTATTRRAPSG